ncbi:MAG: hypothetical protein AB1599_01125 [Planctomycetota bacterium]
MWQIEKTTKRCQECDAIIEVSRHYFSALFPNLPAPGCAGLAADRSAGQAGPTDKAGEPRLLRRDFCANCWEKRTAAGEETPFSFWQTVIEPPAEPPKTPREVLLNFFDNLFREAPETPAAENTPAKPQRSPDYFGAPPSDTRLKLQVKYLFALILMRKKLLRLKSPLTKDNIRYLVLERFSDAKVYEVAEVNISDAELDSLRNEFSQLFEFRI